MFVETNLPYPNRIQIVLAPFIGPFAQDGPLGAFDPRRDLEVYVDGVLQVVQSFSYDAVNNRYLLFMQNSINTQGVVQIVFHVASPSFQGGGEATVAATSPSTTSVLGWIAHTNYSLGQTIVDINGNLETVVGVIGGNETGTSGGSTPAWPTFTGGTVSDNNLIWATHVYQQTVTGFGAFDKFALNSGDITHTTLQAGPLLPANEETMAVLIVNATGPSIASGWVDIANHLGATFGGVQVANFPTPSPISVTETTGTRWSSILLLFAGANVPMTATVTNVQVAANVLTLAVVAPSWIVGTTLTFSGFVGASFLNGGFAVILTNSGTHITAAFTHANYGPTADSGTAHYCPFLQSVEIAPGFTTAGTYSATFPNPVQAGSTILVTLSSGDNNAAAVPTVASDNHGDSYTVYYSFSPGGGPANRAGSGAAVAQNVAGGSTTVSITLGPVNTAGGAIRIFAFELPVGSGVPFAQVPWVPGVTPSATVAVNAPPTVTPPNFVQSNTISTFSSGGVCFGSLLSPSTAGNTLATFVYSNSNDATVTVNDNYGDTFTRQIFVTDGTDYIYAYTAPIGVTGTFAITSVANQVGGHTTYTGTFRNGLAGSAGSATATITGFTTGANNGIFTIFSSTPTTLVLVNGGGVAETHAAMADIPIQVVVNHGSNTRILIGLAEVMDTVGADTPAIVTNKLFSTSTVTSGNFTTSGINELSIGFAAPQTGVPGYTQNDGWVIATPQNTAAIVSKAQPIAVTDAAQITTDKVIVFDQATTASGVVPDSPTVTQITTPFLTPSVPNEWALLLVGQGDAGTTPNGSWSLWEGGPHYNQILSSASPIQGDLNDHPATYSGGGADPTAWAMILLLFELNGGVAPTDISHFTVSGAGGSGTSSSFATSAGNTLMVINYANSPGGIGTWTVHDTQGNAYTHFTARATGTHGNTQTLDVFIAQNIVGGSDQVTFTLSGGLAENWVITGRELVVGREFRMSAMSFFGLPNAGTGPFSQTLTVSGFDGSIPLDATVMGIELVLTGSQDHAAFSSYLSVSPASPVLASPPVFTFQLPATSGDVTIGTPTTTWGYTLTPAFVNNPSNFFFNVQAADTNGNNVNFNLTNAQLKVYYTQPGVVSGLTLVGFAKIGNFSPDGDNTLPASAALVISPSPSPTATAVSLNWNTTNVAHIRITAGGAFDTGVIPVTGGAGSYIVPGSQAILATSGSVTFQMTCSDSGGNPVNVNGTLSPNVVTALYLT
jgi:hypothetical protein